MENVEELEVLLRERGLRMTAQRRHIFEVLAGCRDRHPSIEAIHQAASAEMPTLSLRTVYQVLHDLAALDEIQLIDVGTGRLRVDIRPEDHHHLVCTVCGRVRDVEPGKVTVSVPDDEFDVHAVQVNVLGRCRACVAESAPARTAPRAPAEPPHA